MVSRFGSQNALNTLAFFSLLVNFLTSFYDDPIVSYKLKYVNMFFLFTVQLPTGRNHFLMYEAKKIDAT